MKPVVVASHEDPTQTRAVDILRISDENFGWTECRRDPEDGHGWRPLDGAVQGGFASAAAALADARRAVIWLRDAV